jgi:hypothetical protein
VILHCRYLTLLYKTSKNGGGGLIKAVKTKKKSPPPSRGRVREGVEKLK